MDLDFGSSDQKESHFLKVISEFNQQNFNQEFLERFMVSESKEVEKEKSVEIVSEDDDFS